ncbi:MAG: hypothetical protein FJ100_03885 [Deltaproteobacteria bacterium]|nr:hypothetical protein [Deltaproteobacteria bacterium]
MNARVAGERVGAAWRDALAGLSTLAWAGARSSTRGGQLFRDGWVGRVRLDADLADALVGDGDQGEAVRVRRGERVIDAECTCGVARCAHAVAVVLHLQRQARQAAADQGERDGVLAALRDRLRASQSPGEVAPRALRDLERLPDEAAIDMVALAWRQALRPTANDVAELTLAADRAVAAVATEPARAAGWAVRLLDALGAARPVFTPLPQEACVQVDRLCRTLELDDDPVRTGALFRHATDGAPQIAPRVAALLGRRCARDPQVADDVRNRLLNWAGAQRQRPWREHSEPGGADLLVSACTDALRLAGQLRQAMALALAWPPGRSALVALLGCGQSEITEHATALLSRFDPRGATFGEAAIVAFDQAGPNASRLALWVLDRVADPAWYRRARSASEPAQWPQQRDRWVAAALGHDDPPWLAQVLAEEADAAVALHGAVEAGPLRDRTAEAAIDRLAEFDLDRAVAACQTRLAALCAAADPSHKVLLATADRLCALARQAGMGAAGADYVRLIAANSDARRPEQRLFSALIAAG